MATVWAPHEAPRIGRWAERAYESGWSHTIHFRSLRDLLDQMARQPGLRQFDPTPASRNMRPATPDLRGSPQVTRLGVVAHGDMPGVVQLDRDLTADSVPAYGRELERLAGFLTPDAKLIFYSCVAGAGAAGERLLNALSARLRGRTVIGFTVLGQTEATEDLSAMSPQTPGHVREAPHRQNSGRPGREGLLGPWSVYAKWSRDGTIVRNAPAERQPGNHCANPNCGGHDSALDHCPGWH